MKKLYPSFASACALFLLPSLWEGQGVGFCQSPHINIWSKCGPHCYGFSLLYPVYVRGRPTNGLTAQVAY
ncbi:MAG: hypothetical protein HYY40_02210 [Bacteroidetes bacterium]|nr:hypothetical protein [Bacteroidota bacterium]